MTDSVRDTNRRLRKIYATNFDKLATLPLRECTSPSCYTMMAARSGYCKRCRTEREANAGRKDKKR